MISSDLVIVGYYDYRLMSSFVLISILAAYAARDLSERVKALGGGSSGWSAVPRSTELAPAVCSTPRCRLFHLLLRSPTKALC